MLETKAAVLGDKDFVLPFAAMGLETFPVEGSDDVQKKAQEILAGKYGLVVVAENIAHAADEVFAKTAKKAFPCVVVVPFTTEPEGFAIEALGRMLKMATGIDIVHQV